MCMCVCVCGCVRVCVRACVRACVCVCVYQVKVAFTWKEGVTLGLFFSAQVMAAAESHVSLAFHDIVIASSSKGEKSHDFLPRLTGFLEEALRRKVTVGALYRAMLQVGSLWNNGSESESDLFATLWNFL